MISSNVIDVPAGEAVTYTLSATLSVLAAGTVTNTTTVAPPIGVSDQEPGNNTATDVTQLERILGDGFEGPIAKVRIHRQATP